MSMALLEETFSAAQVGAHLGLSRSAVDLLRIEGATWGRDLHPSRGGLWPSFRTGERRRRFSAAAVEAHKRHLARLDTDAAYVSRQLERAARAQVEERILQHLECRLARLTRRHAA